MLLIDLQNGEPHGGVVSRLLPSPGLKLKGRVCSQLGLSCKVKKFNDTETGDLGMLPTHEKSPILNTATRTGKKSRRGPYRSPVIDFSLNCSASPFLSSATGADHLGIHVLFRPSTSTSLNLAPRRTCSVHEEVFDTPKAGEKSSGAARRANSCSGDCPAASARYSDDVGDSHSEFEARAEGACCANTRGRPEWLMSQQTALIVRWRAP